MNASAKPPECRFATWCGAEVLQGAEVSALTPHWCARCGYYTNQNHCHVCHPCSVCRKARRAFDQALTAMRGEDPRQLSIFDHLAKNPARPGTARKIRAVSKMLAMAKGEPERKRLTERLHRYLSESRTVRATPTRELECELCNRGALWVIGTRPRCDRHLFTESL